MNLFDRAMNLTRRTDARTDPHASLGAVLPTGVAAAHQPLPRMALGTFLARRAYAAKRAWEAKGEMLAFNEARMCRELLEQHRGERAMVEALVRMRDDGDKETKAAAQSVWHGWRTAGGRPSASLPAMPSICIPTVARPESHPRHSSLPRLNVQRSASGRWKVEGR